ncbi:MAG: hypothetical protein U0841_17920 [Chloroflexia bacterium]
MLALDRALGTRLAQRPRFWAFLGIMLLCQLAFDGYLTARPVTLYADPCCHLGPRLPLLNMPIEDLPFGLPLSASLPSSGNGQETPSNVQQRTGEQAMNHHDTQTFVTQLSSIRNPQSAIHNRVPHAPNPPHHPHCLAPDLLVQHRLCVRGRGLRRGQRLKERRNLLALAYFTLPYNLALYGINDIRDYPSDKLNPRKNSVEGGLLPPETHRPVLAWIAALNAPILPVPARPRRPPRQRRPRVPPGHHHRLQRPAPAPEGSPRPDSFISATHYVTPFVYGLALNHAQNYPRQEIAASSPGAWPPSPSARSRTSNSDRAGGFDSIATTLGARRTAQFTALYLLATLLALTGRSAARGKHRRSPRPPPLRRQHRPLSAQPTTRTRQLPLAHLPQTQPPSEPSTPSPSSGAGRSTNPSASATRMREKREERGEKDTMIFTTTLKAPPAQSPPSIGGI